MKTYAERIIEDGITMASDFHGRYELPDWPEGTTSWRCTLRPASGRRMTVPFYMGPALTGEPTIEDVMSCLVSDATSYDNSPTFHEWCSEWGIDLDDRAEVRTATRTHTACAKISAQLHAFLGEKFDAYAYETEAL